MYGLGAFPRWGDRGTRTGYPGIASASYSHPESTQDDATRVQEATAQRLAPDYVGPTLPGKHRRRKEPDSSLLEFTDDFKDMLPAAGTKLLLPDQAQPLSNADVKIILDGEREKAARDGPFTPLAESCLRHATALATIRNRATRDAVESTLNLVHPNLHPWEKTQLINLLPKEAYIAKQLIKSLERRDNDELQLLLDDLRAIVGNPGNEEAVEYSQVTLDGE